VLERLPDGLQTVLGEGGGLVSGGEGQRVRLGRSILRPGVRLVVLDEAFRGLDRNRRGTLLLQAREHWAKATLIFISHDVAETQAFDRILVMEQGRIVEDGSPVRLRAQASRYRALLEAERRVRDELWADAEWRRLWLENGELEERSGTSGGSDNRD
jgi:ATP-binding cassette subfamily B protein